MGVGIGGVEPNGPATLRDRFVELAELGECVAEGDMGVGGIRREPGALAQFGGRLVNLLLAM